MESNHCFYCLPPTHPPTPHPPAVMLQVPGRYSRPSWCNLLHSMESEDIREAITINIRLYSRRWPCQHHSCTDSRELQSEKHHHHHLLLRYSLFISTCQVSRQTQCPEGPSDTGHHRPRSSNTGHPRRTEGEEVVGEREGERGSERASEGRLRLR